MRKLNIVVGSCRQVICRTVVRAKEKKKYRSFFMVGLPGKMQNVQLNLNFR